MHVILYSQQMDNNVRFPVMWASVYTSCSIYVVIRGVTGAAGGRAAPSPAQEAAFWTVAILSKYFLSLYLIYLTSILDTTHDYRTTDVDAIYTLNVSNQQETTKAIMTFCSSVHIRCNFVRILRFRNNFPGYLLELSTTLREVSQFKHGK